MFVSYETIKKHANTYSYNDDWGNTSSNDNAYALLRSKADEIAAQQLIAQIGQEHYNGRVEGDKRNHYLQPLSQMHYDDKLNTPGDKPIIAKSRLGILALIGGLIAAMACFNFINLATAQSTSRSREVGVRKALGSTRNQLLRQFMSETGLIVLFSVALGLGIALLTKPLLKHISFVPDDWPFLSNPVVWGFLGALALIVTVLAGFYPAVLLSRFEAIKALKNNTSNKTGGGGWLRKGLVVAQFTIAQALIVCTLVAISQMNYIQNLDLGYKSDLVQYHFLAYDDSSTIARLSAYKQRLQQIPGVEKVSFSSDVPSSGNTWASNFAYGRGAPDAAFNISLKFFDTDYCSTYGLKVIAGRDLQPSDTMREVLVNQTTLRKLGITNPEEALSKEIKLGGRRFFPIVGVVEDFHSKSVHQEIEPLLMSTRRRFYTIANTKISGNNIQATTAQIERSFNETFPEQYFDSQFMDESIATFYRTEDRFVQLCKGFALIAILISCLGLYGLASLMAVQRTREIGVRKVLGATAQSIIQLMSKDFLRLVLLASLIGLPLAWYAMHQWLQDFVFRTPIHAMVFIATIAVSMLAAFLAISIQTLRAAQLDPVKSLKTE
jgi:putative ABC transport system permease protein